MLRSYVNIVIATTWLACNYGVSIVFRENWPCYTGTALRKYPDIILVMIDRVYVEAAQNLFILVQAKSWLMSCVLRC